MSLIARLWRFSGRDSDAAGRRARKDAAVDVDLFDYEIPPDRIAQRAMEPRDAARLMVLRRQSGSIEDHLVRDLPDLLEQTDLLVANDTRVVPARVYGRKATGGRVEVFLLERLEEVASGKERWRCLIGASRAPREGEVVHFAGGFVAEVIEGPGKGGESEVLIEGERPVREWLEQEGLPPLPPYIKRRPDDPLWEDDRRRYQTLFARVDGAVAAPTAGLHFTPSLIERLDEKGVTRTTITLHVGEGTFRPVYEDDTEEIEVHAESFSISADAAKTMAAFRRQGRRVVAVGTTVCRALETAAAFGSGEPRRVYGETSLFIRPGYRFQAIDALMTNFHLPRSTLLMLVSAFAGREFVLEAYRRAVASGYRFFSYGDGMLIL